MNAIEWLAVRGIDEYYDAVWANRALSKSGGAADSGRLVGAGILLLVHRRLRAQISVFSTHIPAEDLEWVKGHVNVWRLDPPASPNFSTLSNPLIVTAVYVPPEGTDWNKVAGDAIFSALEEYERAVLKCADLNVLTILSLGTSTRDVRFSLLSFVCVMVCHVSNLCANFVSLTGTRVVPVRNSAFKANDSCCIGYRANPSKTLTQVAGC